MWSCAYWFEVTIHQILAELHPFENVCYFFFFPAYWTVYVRSSWNLIYKKTMMWSSAYCFEVTVHHIIADLCPFENSINFLFPANSSYSLHPVKPKLCEYLHYDVEQCILFPGYSTPNITSYAPLKISINFSFSANCYSLHPVKLKIDLLLDRDVEQCRIFQGYSTPNINGVMPH